MPVLDIIQFDFGKEWLKLLLKKLIGIRKKRSEEINAIADVFGDPLLLATYYVEPDCQQFNPADYDNEIATVVREPIFSRLRTFLAYASPTGTRSLLILSDAGMGKTSVLAMLKLTHLLAFWPPGYRCVLLKLGSNSLNEIETIVDKRSTVILLDALDEDPSAWGRVAERLTEILAAVENFKASIITCRTQFFSASNDPFYRRGQVEVGGYTPAVIYNSLLTDAQVLKYIRKRAKTQHDEMDWEHRAIRVVERMGFLRMRPMLLAHLDDILEAKEDLWDEYSLYASLVNAWLRRERRKQLERSDHYPSVETMSRACQLLALKMQTEGRTYITHNEVQLHASIYSSMQPILAQHLGGRSLLNKNSEGDFRFSHYSIQEFLVASYFLQGGSKGEARDIRSTDQMNKLALAWLVKATPEQISTAFFGVFRFDGADLSALDLNNANFSGASFANTIFSRTTFKRSRFDRCDLTGAQFISAKVEECSFVESLLAGARLDDTVVSKSNFLRARFRQANMRSTQFIECTFDLSTFDDATAWPRNLDPESRGSRKLPSEA